MGRLGLAEMAPLALLKLSPLELTQVTSNLPEMYDGAHKVIAVALHSLRCCIPTVQICLHLASSTMHGANSPKKHAGEAL